MHFLLFFVFLFFCFLFLASCYSFLPIVIAVVKIDAQSCIDINSFSILIYAVSSYLFRFVCFIALHFVLFFGLDELVINFIMLHDRMFLIIYIFFLSFLRNICNMINVHSFCFHFFLQQILIIFQLMFYF